MNVGELIALLKDYPKTAEVVIKLHDSEEIQAVVGAVSYGDDADHERVGECVVVSP